MGASDSRFKARRWNFGEQQGTASPIGCSSAGAACSPSTAGAPSAFKIASSSSDRFSGFVKSTAPPSCRQRAASLGKSADESIMIVAPESSGVCLIRAASSNPSITGICASSNTKGYGRPTAAARFSSVSAAMPPSAAVGRIAQLARIS